MKAYEQLAKKITFSLSDVNAITGNVNTSTSIISRLIKKNYVVRIRKDLYTCVDLTTGGLVANKYQIATAISEDSYVSYHTAFELHGVSNQVYNTVYVSSEKRFNTFSFMGITYKRVKSFFDYGVITVKNIEGVRVTDIERTYVDSVNLVSKIGGVEELINITEMLEELDQEKLLRVLELYNKKFIYQKIGYFLENHYSGRSLSENFFEICKEKTGKSVRYLIKGYEGRFNEKWRLVIPEKYITNRDEIGELNDFI